MHSLGLPLSLYVHCIQASSSEIQCYEFVFQIKKQRCVGSNEITKENEDMQLLIYTRKKNTTLTTLIVQIIFQFSSVVVIV